jgi:hypothetical protein
MRIFGTPVKVKGTVLVPIVALWGIVTWLGFYWHPERGFWQDILIGFVTVLLLAPADFGHALAHIFSARYAHGLRNELHFCARRFSQARSLLPFLLVREATIPLAPQKQEDRKRPQAKSWLRENVLRSPREKQKRSWKEALWQKIVSNSNNSRIFWQATHGDSLPRICGLVETSPDILDGFVGCLPIAVPIDESKTYGGLGNIGSLAIKDNSLDNRALLLQSSVDLGVIGHLDQNQGKHATQHD